MKLSSLLHRDAGYSSLAWHASETLPGVRFAVKRASLGQRIELTQRVRQLTLQNEFLRAGDAATQLEAALADLLTEKLYLEWGLERIEGLSIDGREATAATLIANGPESLTNEIAGVIQTENNLTDDERKNS
jgi:hypothetical protein